MSKTIAPSGCTLSLMSTLFDVGRGECGEQMCGERLELALTLENGRRLVSPQSFTITETGRDDDGFLHVWKDKASVATANKALKAAEDKLSAGKLDISDWERGWTVYGSEAWSTEDEMELDALDREDRW